MRASWRLIRQFTRRELESQYLGSISGFIWPLILPLALLAIYSWVFVVIFQARVPEAETVGFVPYLAIALWPWIAFSESLMGAIPAIQANASLIGKVKLPHQILVYAKVGAGFVLQLFGYSIVLLILALLGYDLNWITLPLVACLLIVLFAFTLGLALVLSAVQVFVRDLEQAMRPIITLWFFGTPVLYSLTLIPEQVRWVAWLNPMTWFISGLRDLLLRGYWQFGPLDAAAIAGVLGLLLFGHYVFLRLSSRFEDFL